MSSDIVKKVSFDGIYIDWFVNISEKLKKNKIE